MREPPDRLRFAQEGVAQRWIGGEVRGQDLDRDRAGEAHLAREVDDAHAAAAQLPVQRVLASECRLEGDEVRVVRLRHAAKVRPRAEGEKSGAGVEPSCAGQGTGARGIGR